MKICFVVEDIYPTLNPSTGILNTNGRAVHFKHLGEALMELGHDVSYVTMDHGQKDRENLGGFAVYKMYRPGEGIPGFRFISVKVPKLLRAMKAADADVYVFMCSEAFVGIVAAYCTWNGKLFVYHGGADRDFEGNAWKMNVRDYLFFRYGLKRADLVICQNGFQKKTLMEYYGMEGHVLRNPMAQAERTYNGKGSIVWIAQYRYYKRPEILVELARRIKDDFIMIGGSTPDYPEAKYRKINSLASAAGVKVMGPLSYREVDGILSRAKLLINTSEVEGLSNTFLAAWRRGIPVASFVDPDNMIRENGLGEVAGDIEEMVNAVEKLRKGVPEAYSEHIKEFFDRTFSPYKIASDFMELVDLVRRERQGSE